MCAKMRKMVVMITPVSFATIGYKTYIIFAVINAFIFPVVYFFYPETAYRSLEEMDAIFRKTKGIFNVVSTAQHEPQRYGKHGELLINYEETVEHVARVGSMAHDTQKPMSKGIEHADDDSSQDREKVVI